MDHDSRRHSFDKAAGNKRATVLVVAAALLAALLGFAGSAPIAAQSGQQSLTVDPATVPEAGTYDFTLTPSGYTASNTNLAVCNTGDPGVQWGISALFQYCGGLGSSQDATGGPFTVEGVEVGEEGVTFLLWEPVADGEFADTRVNVDGTGSDDAQTNMVTFSGTVTAKGGESTASVVVSVGVSCWGESCGGEALPSDGSQRPRPLDPMVFLAETGVDSSGSWSVSVSGVEAQDVRSVLLVVWDTHGELATRFIGSETRWELWSWESLSGIDVELEAGGQASGLFADFAGGPPPPGDYALLSNDWPRAFYALDVDPQTGAFTSPVVAPGEYSLAHGNHGGDYLNHNAAATAEVAAGQTTDAGTIEIQRFGQITGKITDSSGQGLGGIAVSGRVSSQSTYRSMGGSPFNRNGSTSFWFTTADDGTYAGQDAYTGQALVPGDWEVEFEIPVPPEPTAIAAGGRHSCAIRAGQTIECWGFNNAGQADPPDGQYTDIAIGDIHSCAIRTDQTITCWGSDNDGRTDAPKGQHTAISASSGYSCAIRADQTITCWGNIIDLNSGARRQILSPEGQYIAIDSDLYYSCAIKIDQTITCWNDRTRELADDTPEGQYTAIAAGSFQTCAIGADQTITCWGDESRNPPPRGQYTAIASGSRHSSCAIRTDQTIACWGFGSVATPRGQYTAIDAGSQHFCAIRTDQMIACWGKDDFGQTSAPSTNYATTLAEELSIPVASGETITCSTVRLATHPPEATTTCTSSQAETAGEPEPEDDGEDSGEPEPEDDDTAGETEPEDDDTAGETEPEDEDAAERCFAVHKFGAQPVDVAKSADRQTVLAQLSWGFHDSIGCYLTLDESALAVLQAAPAPLGFPAADPAASQQCSEIHKFGAQPVDVAKSADRQTVLAQVRWGFHESIGCYLALDTASTAALRAAHT